MDTKMKVKDLKIQDIYNIHQCYKDKCMECPLRKEYVYDFIRCGALTEEGLCTEITLNDEFFNGLSEKKCFYE